MSFGLALSIGWALFWRWFLVGTVPLAFFFMITGDPQLAESPMLAVLQPLLSFLAFFIAVFWLFSNGRFGSLRVILMEQAHYQRLSSEVAEAE